jgi:hypothetical protein
LEVLLNLRSIGNNAAWIMWIKTKGEERLAVCANGGTSIDPTMPGTDGGYESLAAPDWPCDFKQKYRYSLLLYFYGHGDMAFCDD